MTTTRKQSQKQRMPAPPTRQAGPTLNASPIVLHWLEHYWQKLELPAAELGVLALTQDRQEYTRWTSKRLNFMVLGCYCYLPAPARANTSGSTRHESRHASATPGLSMPLPGFGDGLSVGQLPPLHRHLIFIEPDLQPRSLEVTVAHELIHLADRVHGTPRRHRHHGYDSIAADEAAVTGYDLEELRRLLHEESTRREQQRRSRRPIRYLYECPNCGKEYPRARRYSQAVSCSHCDKTYNPRFCLRLRAEIV